MQSYDPGGSKTTRKVAKLEDERPTGGKTTRNRVKKNARRGCQEYWVPYLRWGRRTVVSKGLLEALHAGMGRDGEMLKNSGGFRVRLR